MYFESRFSGFVGRKFKCCRYLYWSSCLLNIWQRNLSELRFHIKKTRMNWTSLNSVFGKSFNAAFVKNSSFENLSSFPKCVCCFLSGNDTYMHGAVILLTKQCTMTMNVKKFESLEVFIEVFNVNTGFSREAFLVHGFFFVHGVSFPIKTKRGLFSAVFYFQDPIHSVQERNVVVFCWTYKI